MKWITRFENPRYPVSGKWEKKQTASMLGSTDLLQSMGNDGESITPRSPALICTLPYDIIHYISLFLTEDDPDNTPRVLSHICHQWRLFALESPSLWCRIRFNGPPPYDQQRIYIDRSRDALLDIKIGISPWRVNRCKAASELMRLILPHVHRWRRFWLFTSLKTMRVICDQLRDARAAELERLALSVWQEYQEVPESTSMSHKVTWYGWTCRAFGGGLPKLEKLKIDADLLSIRTGALPHNCNSSALRRLRLDLHDLEQGRPNRTMGTDISQQRSLAISISIVQALNIFSHLEHLHLSDQSGLGCRIETQLLCSPRIVLPNLKHLRTSALILHHLDAPLLQICPEIIARSEHMCTTILHFPRLTRLEFFWAGTYTNSPRRIFRKFICTLEYLQELCLRGLSIDEEDLKALGYGCPQLYCLALFQCRRRNEGCEPVFDDIFLQILRETVQARITSPTCKPLTILTVLPDLGRDVKSVHEDWLRAVVPHYTGLGDRRGVRDAHEWRKYR
ncbi:hypothetical protein FRC02_005448 [Tulasnella sp. 418]|nr:hypothetical protein FRC02_005448 [Tulasnella sp. 418]